MKSSLIWIAFLSIITISCEVKPAQINYGVDACHFCKMTIVDRHHAAQVVTVKGKAFKYDAIECMMNDLNDWNRPAIQYYLTNDYSNPGELIDATNASYLICQAIPSPMGKFLSSFNDLRDVEEILKEKRGRTLNWEELKNDFSN